MPWKKQQQRQGKGKHPFPRHRSAVAVGGVARKGIFSTFQHVFAPPAWGVWQPQVVFLAIPNNKLHPLPAGSQTRWQTKSPALLDGHGGVFLVDHVSRQTFSHLKEPTAWPFSSTKAPRAAGCSAVAPHPALSPSPCGHSAVEPLARPHRSPHSVLDRHLVAVAPRIGAQELGWYTSGLDLI